MKIAPHSNSTWNTYASSAYLGKCSPRITIDSGGAGATLTRNKTGTESILRWNIAELDAGGGPPPDPVPNNRVIAYF